MSVPMTFQVYQLLASKPMSLCELKDRHGLTTNQARGAIDQLIRTKQIKRIRPARQGYVYGVSA